MVSPSNLGSLQKGLQVVQVEIEGQCHNFKIVCQFDATIVVLMG